jgi:hypothetical protein
MIPLTCPGHAHFGITAWQLEKAMFCRVSAMITRSPCQTGSWAALNQCLRRVLDMRGTLREHQWDVPKYWQRSACRADIQGCRHVQTTPLNTVISLTRWRPRQQRPVMNEQHFTYFMSHTRKLKRTFPKVAWEDRSIEWEMKFLVLGVPSEEELSGKTFVLKISSYTCSQSWILLFQSCCMVNQITADVSTEGADRKFSVLGCFQRIPYISVSSSPIHIKTE